MAVTTVKFDVDSATKKVVTAFEKVRRNPQMNKEIGEFLVKRIKAETRRKKPFNKTRSFPSLKTSTIRGRTRLAKLNKTHITFGPDRSNLTFTGQLIEGIKFTIKKTIITIATSGKRKTIRIGQKRSAKKTPISSRNEILVKALADKGFFLLVDGVVSEDEKIINRVSNIVLKFIRRSLSVQNRLDKL